MYKYISIFISCAVAFLSLVQADEGKKKTGISGRQKTQVLRGQ